MQPPSFELRSTSRPLGPDPRLVGLGVLLYAMLGWSLPRAEAQVRLGPEEVEAPRPARWITHKARRGETLSRVAERYGVSEAQVRTWNPKVAVDGLRPGQILQVKTRKRPASSSRGGRTAERSARPSSRRSHPRSRSRSRSRVPAGPPPPLTGALSCVESDDLARISRSMGRRASGDTMLRRLAVVGPHYERAADRHPGVPLSLLLAYGLVESGFRVSATSDAGAQGLMQIMPSTWRNIRPRAGLPGNASPYDPADATEAAAWHLEWMAKEIGGAQVVDGVKTEPAVAAAYFAGVGAVRRHGVDLEGWSGTYGEKVRRYARAIERSQLGFETVLRRCASRRSSERDRDHVKPGTAKRPSPQVPATSRVERPLLW